MEFGTHFPVGLPGRSAPALVSRRCSRWGLQDQLDGTEASSPPPSGTDFLFGPSWRPCVLGRGTGLAWCRGRSFSVQRGLDCWHYSLDNGREYVCVESLGRRRAVELPRLSSAGSRFSGTASCRPRTSCPETDPGLSWPDGSVPSLPEKNTFLPNVWASPTLQLAFKTRRVTRAVRYVTPPDGLQRSMWTLEWLNRLASADIFVFSPVRFLDRFMPIQVIWLFVGLRWNLCIASLPVAFWVIWACFFFSSCARHEMDRGVCSRESVNNEKISNFHLQKCPRPLTKVS